MTSRRLFSIEVGDLVCFKRIYKMDINDLISRSNYSKYMMVIGMFNNVKPACKVLCANGEINWVALERLERAK